MKNLNPAVHGHEIDPDILLWMKNAGPGFVYALDALIERAQQRTKQQCSVEA